MSPATRAGVVAAVPWVVAAVLSTLIALFTAGFDERWDVPLEYTGDGLAVGAHVKTVLETGWYESQSALGAPFGQVYHDYPVAENLHFAVAALLGLTGLPWGAVMNLHFLLGFPLAAITGMWLFRRLGVSRWLAAAVAIVFAIAPYHFSRGEGHLFLSWYWVVPLGVALALDVLAGRPLWGARAGARRGLGHVSGRTGLTLASLLLLGTASIYYSAFTGLLCAFAALGALVTLRRPWRLLGVLAAGGVLAGVILLNGAPDLLYVAANGANPGALRRTPVESEVYALKLAQLLLPAPFHRVPALREFRALYDDNYPLPSESPALGLLASVGLVILIVTVFTILARTVLAREGPARDDKLPALAFLTLGALLFAWVGGLSTLISFATTSIRAWNRMSIVIAALALAGLALVVDRLLNRVAAIGVRRALITAAVAVSLVGVAVIDQTPPSSAARAAGIASFDSDADFVAGLEDDLPAGSLIFQVPALPFPESPPEERALDADQLRPYLHSTDLRFSGGGIRGRADIESLRAVAELPANELVAAAAELGFRGVVVDTWAYTDPESEIDALGTPTRRSADGRLVYIPLS